MIVIRNRKMVIPYEDVYIGTSYDTNTEIRMFKVQRYTSNHKDLAALNFRLDLRYNITDQNAADTVMLSKEVHDDYILLKWEITESVLQAPGTAFINLRATENGTNRWSTFIAAVYIGHTLYTPGSYTGSLTEIEQMEADFDHFKQVIEDLEPLVNLTDTAEAWAVGQRNGHDVASSDITYHNNAKYYSGTAMYAAADSENFRNLSQAYAEGKIGSQDVDSDDPAYHNNAKYYRDNAATSSSLSVAMAETAEAWAEGEINDDPVDSSHPAYHNNAKYYAEQASYHSNAALTFSGNANDFSVAAAASASAAANSAENAAASEDNAEASASAAQASDASAATAASNSEAWAVGQRNGANVGSSDSTYHNNAKYYAEQADALSNLADAHKDAAQLAAQQAASSATSAAGSALDASDYADQAAESATAAAASAASLAVDTALSDTSENPVQNKVITSEITDVKSAIRQVDDNVYDDIYNGHKSVLLDWGNGWVNSNGVYTENSDRYLIKGRSTEDASDVVNGSASTVYIVYFSSYASLTNFTYDSYVLVNAGRIVSINKTKAYFLIESTATSDTGLTGVKLLTDTPIAYLSKASADERENAFNQLKNATAVVTQESTTVESAPTWTSGYVEPNGTVHGGGTSYIYSSYVSVNPGDTVNVLRESDGPAINSFRFLTAYKDGVAVAASGGTNVSTPYTVPEGVDAIVLSIAAAYGTASKVSRTYMEDVYAPAEAANVNTLFNIVASAKAGRIEYVFDVTANGTYSASEQLEDMCGYRICFTAKVSAITGTVKIGKGIGLAYGGGIGFDGTNLYQYNGTATDPVRTQVHGLTIKDYVSITLDVPYGVTSKCYMRTNGGEYVWTIPYWTSRYGALSVQSVDALTDCKLSYTCEGLIKDTWMYGDSYFHVVDTSRWTTYLIQTGHTNFLLNGYPGRASQAALASFKTDLSMHRVPRRVLWCMGMNDKDSASAPNANWLSAVEEVMQICEDNHIELVLSTIPNTPSTATKNDMKNAYVRASGYRYIDFANAVSADGSSTWYNGMLSSDNVHPDVQGALALYSCAVTEVPELLL